MTFTPLGERHAIVEVVFVLHVSPAITHTDREKLKNAHASWQLHLPRLVEPPTVSLHFSDSEEAPPSLLPIQPLDLDRHKADGELEWHLHIGGKSIAVNCLAYTRWQHIWKHARALLAPVSGILPETTVIASASLQYINLFSWNGPTDDYDPRVILDEQSPCAAERPQSRSSLASPSDVAPPEGRILDRMHIDAISSQHGEHLVKLENLRRFEFDDDSAVPHLAAAFSNAATVIDARFESLHALTKKSLGNYLTAHMRRIINLHAE